jgi:hypothetical protein
MRYLFAFQDVEMCGSFSRALKAQGIACEIRSAQEFPDGTQGPELWVRDDEDYDRAMQILTSLQGER